MLNSFGDSSCFFFKTGMPSTVARYLSLPYHLPLAEGYKRLFYAFQKALVSSETQMTSTRI